MERKDLIFHRKTSKGFYVIVKEDGAYVDITDWTVYFTVKVKHTDPDTLAVIAKDITSHADPISGKTLIELTPVDLDLDPGNYWYDIVGKDGSGNVHLIAIGKLKLEEKITQRS